MTDKNNISICKSLTSLTILKVIINTTNPDDLDTKLIFVGNRPENIQTILTKLENNKQLTSNETTELETTIPYYTIKFGNLDNYNVKFIYHYLEENIPIKHMKIILYETIKNLYKNQSKQFIANFHPDNQCIYKYSRNIDYSQYIDILGYIFENKNKKELTNEEFFDKLYKITFLTKAEINTKLKTDIFPAKYKDIKDDVTFVSHSKYFYDVLLNSEDLLHLILNISHVISTQYSYIHDQIKYHYFGYQNIGHVIKTITSKNKDNTNENTKENTKTNTKEQIKNIKFFKEYTLTHEVNTNDSHLLSYFNKTINNEYYLIIVNELENLLSKDMINYYFPLSIETQSASLLDKNNEIFANVYNKLKLNTIQKHVYNDGIISIMDCYCKNMMFDFLSENLNMKYDLKNLYNNLITTYYRPIIKYFTNGEFQLIKINKQFLQNHSYQEINKLLVGSSVLKNNSKYYIEGLDYIQYKWRISKDIILTINFYENGYSRIFFDDNNNFKIGPKLLQYLNLSINTIKGIKKIINANNLLIPNLNNIFNENTTIMRNANLINGNIIINAKLDIKKLQTVDEMKKNGNKLDVKLFLARLKKYSNTIHQFKANNKKIITDSIKIFYTNVDNFYSDESLKHFIKASILDTKKADDKTIENLISICSEIFLLDKDYIRKIYKSLESSSSDTITEKLLYGIEIELKVDNDGNIDISIENIDKYHTVKLILFYLKMILSSISWDIQHNNEPIQQSKPQTGKSKNKKVSKKDASIDELDDFGGLDLDFDLDKNLLDLELDLDVSNAFDDGEQDIDLDMNLDDLAKLIQLDKLPEKDDQSNSDDSSKELKTLELVKMNGKHKKLTFTTYMKDMRMDADKELFFPEASGSTYRYNRKCGAVNMRQPYIVTKKDIESYDDPEAFNGYLKYRGNYYICPRIWDYKAKKPISVRKFIEAGLKSPYTNGTYIPVEKRNDIELDDKYTVIIRIPANANNSEWEDSSLHKDWPEILKKTEKEAYPSLMPPSDHPNKLCAPCCGSKKPEDFDPNKKEIQQIFKPQGPKECRDKLLEETDNDDKKQQKDNIELVICSDTIDPYITNETSELEKCRLGLIPHNLDIILNNHQYLFLNKTQNQLLENANVFLRRGIEKNKKENILETFAVIRNVTLDELKRLIVDKLSPEVFVTLNNGELIDIFSSNAILPNSLADFDKFAKFVTTYNLFFNLLDIDYAILERLKYKDIELLNLHVNDNSQLQNFITKVKKTGIDDIINLKKIIIAYKIYTAFYNYIGHIINDNEYKNYKHFLDLFSKPIEWLNKDGLNILIFDKTASKLVCNPYVNLYRSHFCILLQDEPFVFIPIIHVNNVYKKNTMNGVFEWNKINVNEATFNYMAKRIPNKKILELTRKRENALINLVNIHGNICKFQYQSLISELMKDLDEMEIKPINQLAFTTTQIEFIKLDKSFDNILIPIYPKAIESKQHTVKFKLLESSDLVTLDTYLNLFSNKSSKPINPSNPNKKKDQQQETEEDLDKKKQELSKKLIQYNYKISKIFYNELTNEINSIQFINNLVLPIHIEKLNNNRKQEIIKKMIDIGELKGLEDPRIDSLFKPAYYDFQLNISPEIDIVNVRNLIYKDFIYNYFKYDFSRLLQENTYKKIKNALTDNIENRGKYTFEDMIDNLMKLVNDLMQNNISSNNTSGKSLETVRNIKQIKLKVCSKTKKNGKCTNAFCAFDEKANQCYLDMNKEQLMYYSYLLANDLINNKMESRDIINGSFIPEYNMRNKIFRNPDEIILNTNELANIIENGIYSKFKKNITISDYLKGEDEAIFSKHDYTVLQNTDLEQFKKIMNTIIPEVVDLSIKNIFQDYKIFTTPFDKDGKYDQTSNIGDCKFPFFDKNKKKYVYQCLPRNSGLMCPTKVDFHRKPDKWGYCPEKIEESRKELKVIETETEGNNKDYFEGTCNFPFVSKTKNKHPKKDDSDKINIQSDSDNDNDGDDNIDHKGISEYRLKYDCSENTEEQFSWCPLKIAKTLKNTDGTLYEDKDGHLLKAANKFEHVHLNTWYKGKLSITGLTSKKHVKGYCRSPPPKTKKGVVIEEDEDDDGLPEITLDNYVPNYCGGGISPSKGGYSRDQLYKFGINHLKIPRYQLRNKDKKKQKPELCKIINQKFRQIKTYGKEITNEDRVKAYVKDIDHCEDGESKGGYSLQELRELAINFYNVSESEAKDMYKPDLCKHIKKTIKTLTGETITDEDILTKDIKSLLDTKINMIYPGDINLCKETPNRGGKGTKEVKKIASENFGIDTEHKHKEQICDEIEAKIKNIKKIIKRDDSNRVTRLSPEKARKIRLSLDESLDNANLLSEIFDDETITKSKAKRGSVSSISKSRNNNRFDESEDIELPLDDEL